MSEEFFISDELLKHKDMVIANLSNELKNAKKDAIAWMRGAGAFREDLRKSQAETNRIRALYESLARSHSSENERFYREIIIKLLER